MANQAQERFAAIRDKPAVTQDGVKINLQMNAGLLADLPSIDSSGAEGVGLYPNQPEPVAQLVQSVHSVVALRIP